MKLFLHLLFNLGESMDYEHHDDWQQLLKDQDLRQRKRRTKIIATLGPSTDNPDILYAMFAAKVDVVRLNFSHGDAEAHKLRVAKIRKLSKEFNRHVAILGDLQGPKIRVCAFKQSSITLVEDANFYLRCHFRAR